MRVIVWNVNGLRSCLRQGFRPWFDERCPDLLGLQEVRAKKDQLPADALDVAGFGCWLNPAERPGYSGTALFAKRTPLALTTSLGRADFDAEGRVQIAEYERFAFINAYFPNGKGKDRSNDRVPFKLAFYAAVLDAALALRRAGKGVIVGGDFNTAHRPIDLANWQSNQKTSGFLPAERQEIDRWLQAGFVDVFRETHRDEPGHYSWWSQRSGSRERNVGWRIDYLLVSDDLAPRVQRAWIEPEVMGSDHAPVGIEVDLVL